MNDMAKEKIEAVIFSIQRFSTEDGPGIRTTVFFKGCPMTCLWCHNPESLVAKPQSVWFSTKCIGCRTCQEICKNLGLLFSDKGIAINRENCIACGDCAEECPSLALELLGKRYSPADLAEIVLKDKVFYETSGGGVTCSGGEAMIYVKFLEEFLPIIKEEKIHIALDTCGAANIAAYKRVLPYIDLILFDIKTMNQEEHFKYTGIKLEKVLEAVGYLKDSGKPLWIRTPIIPGYTDSVENIAAISKFIVDDLKGVERFDLLAFSNLCADKYKQLDMQWDMESGSLLKKEKLETLVDQAKNHGVENVVFSGPVKLE